MTSGNNECDATIPASIPWSTAGTGVAYSTGYSLRWSSMAFLTRSSSSMLTVLIHVISYSLILLGLKISRHKKSAAGWVCIRPQVFGVPPGGKFGLAGSAVCDPFIDARQKHDNTAKELGLRIFFKSFTFNALIAFPTTQI